jgi:uncharacterized protein (TIGR03083 family)
MNSTVTTVSDIPAVDHDEAMAIAEVEYARLLDTVDSLEPSDWAHPTDCAGWDVKAVIAHLLGMMKLLADRAEFGRQISIAGQRAAATGALRIDALTGLQVEEHAHLTTGELVAAVRAAAPAALAGRSATTAEERAALYTPGPPFDGDWTRGYLLDIIHNRDPWLHRIDIGRATGRDIALTPDHDGRIVADVVADWARRHGQPFTLVIDGSAGGTFVAAGGGETHELDAVEFCRILSGRATGSGLLNTEVPF